MKAENNKGVQMETQATADAEAKPSLFKKLEKKQGKLRIALTGPSGSGKTYSALLIAEGIRESMKKAGVKKPRVGMVDTENLSAADYADKFDVLGVAIQPPYTVGKYIAAYKAAVDEGIDVLIIDSLSHAWAGEGGLLDKKAGLDSRPGSNQFTNWGPISAEHQKFLAMLVNSQLHLITTLRSKQDYVLQDNGKGKQAPVKVGLAPVQREGLEYEMQVVFDLGMDHSAKVNKDRTGMFDGTLFTPTKALGHDLYKWRMQGKDETSAGQVEVQEKAPEGTAPSAVQGNGHQEETSERPSADQLMAIKELCGKVGTSLQKEKVRLGYGQRILTVAVAEEIIAGLQEHLAGAGK